MKVKSFIIAVFLIFVSLGCKKEEPQREEVKVIRVEEAFIIQNAKGEVEGHRKSYTVLESLATKVRYKEEGMVGEVGDVFMYDVANSIEL